MLLMETYLFELQGVGCLLPLQPSHLIKEKKKSFITTHYFHLAPVGGAHSSSLTHANRVPRHHEAGFWTACNSPDGLSVSLSISVALTAVSNHCY